MQYETKDLSLAAFLVQVGHRLERIEPAGRLKVFHFSGDVQPDVTGYFNGAVVPAREYANAIRDLKAQCNPR